jgi:hypothetical protein
LRKYFVQTYHQLPLSKHLWDNIQRITFLLNKMLAMKPPEYPINDLENSISVVSFDSDVIPNWKQIYQENIAWHWSTVRLKKTRISKNALTKTDKVATQVLGLSGRIETRDENQASVGPGDCIHLSDGPIHQERGKRHGEDKSGTDQVL